MSAAVLLDVGQQPVAQREKHDREGEKSRPREHFERAQELAQRDFERGSHRACRDSYILFDNRNPHFIRKCRIRFGKSPFRAMPSQRLAAHPELAADGSGARRAAPFSAAEMAQRAGRRARRRRSRVQAPPAAPARSACCCARWRAISRADMHGLAGLAEVCCDHERPRGAVAFAPRSLAARSRAHRRRHGQARRARAERVLRHRPRLRPSRPRKCRPIRSSSSAPAAS